MKKTASAALCSIFALAMAACSSSTGTDSTSSANGSQASSAASSTAAASSASGDAQTILIGISPDYPPYESKSASGEIEGFDPDMTKWIFDYLNENGHNYKYEFEELSFDTIISSLQAGQIDLGISGFTYDEKRGGIFSDSYYDSAQVLVVAEDSEISTTNDLNGKVVGAQQGTTGEEAANGIEDAEVQATSDANLMMENLKAHGIDAVVIDKAVADNYVAQGGFKIVGEDLMDEENIIYSTEEHQELMDQINEAIKAFKDSGEYETLTKKWFAAGSAEE